MFSTVARTASVMAFAILLLALSAPPVQADRPSGECPGDKWMVSVYPMDWEPGDPIPGGDDYLIWAMSLEGLITEFGSVEAGLEALGFDSLEEAFAFSIALDVRIDKNVDGAICFSDLPDTPGHPAFVFNAVDNTSHS